MTDIQSVRDDSDLRKYRTEIPNMADDDLDPFQYRLYAHYKRVCGANGGECHEGVRTTAGKTRMSAEKVIATRQWLADNSWIELWQGAKGIFHITIVDRWGENFIRYSERSNRQTVRNSEQSTRRPLEIPNSTVRNSEQSPLEIPNERKNSIKKEPEKKVKSAPTPSPKPNDYLPGLPDPRKRQSQAKTLAAQTADIAKMGVDPKQFRLIVDEILRGMGKLELAEHDERTLTEAQDVARCLVALDTRYKTPDGVKAVFDTWYGNNEFSGKAPYASQVKSYANQIIAGKVKPKPATNGVTNYANYGGGLPDYMRE